MKSSDLWTIIVLASSAITAAVVLLAIWKTPSERIHVGRVLWVFFGAISAIAVSIGLVDMAINGYGDGTIF